MHAMFTELLQAEIWRKKLEAAGFKVLPEAWPPQRDSQTPSRDERERTTLPGIASAPT